MKLKKKTDGRWIIHGGFIVMQCTLGNSKFTEGKKNWLTKHIELSTIFFKINLVHIKEIKKYIYLNIIFKE